MPSNNPGKDDPYPHRIHVKVFEEESQAWELARAIAASLVHAELVPEYGVRTLPMVNGNKSRRYIVQIGGPGPLPEHIQDEIDRTFGERADRRRPADVATTQEEVLFHGA